MAAFDTSVFFRNLPVCEDCWKEHSGEREPVRVAGDSLVSCVMCEQPTASGIFVRMRLEWSRTAEGRSKS